jgi:hypothetical protein
MFEVLDDERFGGFFIRDCGDFVMEFFRGRRSDRAVVFFMDFSYSLMSFSAF